MPGVPAAGGLPAPINPETAGGLRVSSVLIALNTCLVQCRSWANGVRPLNQQDEHRRSVEKVPLWDDVRNLPLQNETCPGYFSAEVQLN